MKVANFGSLQAWGVLRPQDYKNYLRMISATNKAVKKPQLHVAISAGGKLYDKHELTEIATQWLGRMGYDKQPYLIIFHKDTANNHIHVVSTRVNKQGKKIRDSFEQIKGQEQMNIVMGLDEKHSAAADITKALAYHFAARVQFMMILESRGYTLKEQEGKLLVIKFGKRQGEISLSVIEEGIKKYAPDHLRKTQLKAIFHKYAAGYDTSPVKKHGIYTSAFAAYMKEKFDVDLVFHASGDKPPYGYSVIDHSGKNVFKGGEIMPLKELLAIQTSNKEPKEKAGVRYEVNAAQLDYYAAILKAALNNYPDVTQGLQHHGLVVIRNGEGFTLHDPSAGVFMNASDLLGINEQQLLLEHFSQAHETGEEIYRQHLATPNINLTSDIDDEAIHGRNRRRKKKARTNSR